MSIYDHTDPMDYMPEIPSEQLKGLSDEDLYLIGCIYPLATMVILFILLIICAIVAWMF